MTTAEPDKKKGPAPTGPQSKRLAQHRKDVNRLNTTEAAARKTEPLPPAFSAALMAALETETDPERSVAEIVLELAAEYETTEPTC